MKAAYAWTDCWPEAPPRWAAREEVDVGGEVLAQQNSSRRRRSGPPAPPAALEALSAWASTRRAGGTARLTWRQTLHRPYQSCQTLARTSPRVYNGAAMRQALASTSSIGSPPTRPATPRAGSCAELRPAPSSRLSANENPLGPSPRVVEALRPEAARVHLYPDGGSTALARGPRRLDRRRARPGSSSATAPTSCSRFIARAAFEPGDEVVLPHPAFEPYSTEAVLAGRHRCASPLPRLRDGPGRHGAARDRRAPRRSSCARRTTRRRRIVRARPARPLLDALGPDPPLVVLDEAYRDFCDDPETPGRRRAAGATSRA